MICADRFVLIEKSDNESLVGISSAKYRRRNTCEKVTIVRIINVNAMRKWIIEIGNENRAWQERNLFILIEQKWISVENRLGYHFTVLVR